MRLRRRCGSWKRTTSGARPSEARRHRCSKLDAVVQQAHRWSRARRMTSAVVFAYHNVGARCLRVVLAHRIRVDLVVTHHDDPAENQWFERVADVAADYAIPCIAP